LATDDLYTPLGLDKKPARGGLSPLIYPVIPGLLGIALVTFVIWNVVHHDRSGGKPMAAAKTDMSAPGHAAKLSPSEPDARRLKAPAPSVRPRNRPTQALERAKEETLDQAAAERMVTVIDGRTGAHQQVKIPAPAAPRSSGAPTSSSSR
jgi:hypothetical protein